MKKDKCCSAATATLNNFDDDILCDTCCGGVPAVALECCLEQWSTVMFHELVQVSIFRYFQAVSAREDYETRTKSNQNVVFSFWLESSGICVMFFNGDPIQQSSTAETCMPAAVFPLVSALRTGWKLTPTKSRECGVSPWSAFLGPTRLEM